MSLESVEELESLPAGKKLRSSQSCNRMLIRYVFSGTEGAPPPRRRSLSKLRRRLSRTFRFSFSGSLTDFSHTFTIAENALENEEQLAEDEEAVVKGATSRSNGKNNENQANLKDESFHN